MVTMVICVYEETEGLRDSYEEQNFGVDCYHDHRHIIIIVRCFILSFILVQCSYVSRADCNRDDDDIPLIHSYIINNIVSIIASTGGIHCMQAIRSKLSCVTLNQLDNWSYHMSY